MGASDKAGSDSPERTNLKAAGHARFFEVLDFSSSPTEALRAAFRRQQDRPSEDDADQSSAS